MTEVWKIKAVHRLISPGRVEVNTREGDYGILTNAHIKAAENTEAGYNVMAGNDITAGQSLSAKRLIMVDKNARSTEITPAEIRLVNQGSGNKFYVANDYLKFENRERFSINVDARSVKNDQYPYRYLGALTATNTQGMFSELNSQYLKIPLIEIPDPNNDSWEPLADKLNIL